MSTPEEIAVEPRVFNLRQSAREAPTDLDPDACTPMLGEVLSACNTILAEAVGSSKRVEKISGAIFGRRLLLVAMSKPLPEIDTRCFARWSSEPTTMDHRAATQVMTEALGLLNITLARAVDEDMRVLHVIGLFHSGRLRLLFKGVGLDTPKEIAERYLRECIPHP